MAAYISLAAMVLLSIIGSTWHMSSKLTTLEMRVDQNSDKIESLETSLNSQGPRKGGGDG